MNLNSTFSSNLRRLTVLFFLGVLSISRSSAATFDWTGASGTDDLWATAGNWNPSGVPDTADSVIFGDADIVGDAFTVNNIVGANKTIAALSYTNSLSGTWHVTQIPSGVTLTVAGTVIVGGGNAMSLDTSRWCPRRHCCHGYTVRQRSSFCRDNSALTISSWSVLAEA